MRPLHNRAEDVAPVPPGHTRLMASGHTHEAINTAALIAIAVTFATLQDQPKFDPRLGEVVPLAARFVFGAAYLIGTFLVTPDLDLAEGNVRAKKHWGLLGILWIPYGWLLTHRGISHTWLAGPVTRLLYMAFVLAALAVLLSPIRPVVESSLSVSVSVSIPWPSASTAAIAGYLVSQWLHLLADGIMPWRR